MSTNLLHEAAHLLMDQMKKVTSAKGNDLDKEVMRLDSISKGASGISELADKQIKVLYATGFLPDQNILVNKDEAKLVNAKRSVEKKVPSSKGFIDEFTRQ